ncbi:DUF6529 family protein [Cryptosporangium sp. NPDC051539]|uniref:DUF6529 family protein n=1 Tax=Cryptosporangium sp. NPDC051539 TaxID=3363962 RepID=UPI0037B57623
MTWNPDPDEAPTRAFQVPQPRPAASRTDPTVLRTTAATGPPPPPLRPATTSTVAKLIVPVAIGAGVAVVLGTYGKLHTPTGIAVSVAGFSGPLQVKVWLATVAVVLAVVQLITALAMWGKLPLRGSWVSPVHRWSGRVAFVLTIPVVIHCLYALGFADYSARTLAHSILGCLFFGVFTTKMLVLTKHGLAGWVLPLFGGAVFAALVGVWATSAAWFFGTSGFQF